jgi:signal transduction histidine kinase
LPPPTWLKRPAEWAGALSAGWRDTVLTAVVTLLSFTPGFADKGTSLAWNTSQRSFGLLAALLVLGHCLPLLIRSRAPALCLMLVSAAFCAYQCLGYRPTLATIALYIALYSAGMHQSGRRRTTAAAWVAGYAALSGCLIALGAPLPPVESAGFFTLPAGCWLLGAWARTQLQEQARQQHRDLASAMREERERIARELHDVVTHHVTAIVMQADAMLYVPPDDRKKIETGLSTVADTGRHALADLRQLLGVLSPRHDTEPAPRAPTAGLFSDLVEQTRLAGQPVEIAQEGLPEVADGVAGLVAYRVVQEALTNALKHAPGRKTVVRVSAAVLDQMTVEVTTEGLSGKDTAVPVSGPWPAPSGRGLAGLHRRVLLAGGELTTEQAPNGDFAVRALLPLEQDAT